MERRLPLLVCFVSGLLMFVMYFSSHPTARLINLTVPLYWQIVFAFTLIIGVVSYLRNNVRGIRKGESRPYRIVSVAGFVTMVAVAAIWGIRADTPFMWIFENIQVPMQSTVFALLAFFVASASFRGFRARSIPATILLITALLILLSRTPLGNLFDFLPDLADWLRNYPSMSARRAILVGIGLGSLTTSLRVIIGIERTWLGGDK
ncbi:MAG: hypothetical protein KAT79_02530 [candidate division Zixibacteria bacterium]|nr:hypothetical protein [candidate division Zixibacteria bacterium]